ncbi:YdeI family protein [Leeuwenhoekiella sp. NPDC079379]|uniref:YdeI family protein n=1 Tax=Leeuwenhoekiella sp. NPDC079379 TaxID=3364122 RepID=UPI0037C55CC3
MSYLPLLYFKNAEAWRAWLHLNHDSSSGVELIFYKVACEEESMRWEEAVKVAICYGWIDSTVRKLDDKRRKQYFCKRKPKSVWSAVNKGYVEELYKDDLIHPSGHKAIITAKDNGSWTALDNVEEGIIPEDLQVAFTNNPEAFDNYQNFAKGYQKSYLYWLNQAKRQDTRHKRINEIINLCFNNKKQRS